MGKEIIVLLRCLAVGLFSGRALAVSSQASPKQLRRSPSITHGTTALQVAQPAFERSLKNSPEIVPSPFAEPKGHKRRVMDAINKFRAEICAKMKDEHGVEFASFDQCHKFMKQACNPGKDRQMDGDKKEITSGEGYCEEYFPEAEKKAEKQVSDEEAKEPKIEVVAPPAPSPGPSPGPSQDKEPASAPQAAAGGGNIPAPAPAAGPAGSPSSPAPGPFTPGLSAGKPGGPIPADEAWYYKKDGKDMSRMHMKEDMKLPTHGYWGKLVEHEDMQTSVSDWGKEFGNPETSKSLNAFCRKHPENPWCPKRSSCWKVSATIPLFLLVGMAF